MVEGATHKGSDSSGRLELQNHTRYTLLPLTLAERHSDDESKRLGQVVAGERGHLTVQTVMVLCNTLSSNTRDTSVLIAVRLVTNNQNGGRT